PASLLRSAACTRAPKQSPGLFLCFALPFSNLALYKKQVHKSAPAFLWRRRRDSPASLLRSAARTRPPKQSPGLFLCFALPFSNLALYKKQVHKSAPAFLWRRRRDSPASLLRSAARTRAPKQSPGLFLCFALPFSNLAL